MFQMRYRLLRVLMMLASGALVLQATGCDWISSINTALLAVLTGTTIYVATNI